MQHGRMSETETLFAALRQSIGDNLVTMLGRMVREAPDHRRHRQNALLGVDLHHDQVALDRKI